MPSTNNAAAQSSATPMPIWMARFGSRATTPEPDQAPSDRGRDHQHQRQGIDTHGGDEYERLRDGRQRMTGIQRAGNAFVGHEPQ